MELLVLVVTIIGVIVYMGLGRSLRTVGDIVTDKTEDLADAVYEKRMMSVKETSLTDEEIEAAHERIMKIRKNRRKMSGL